MKAKENEHKRPPVRLMEGGPDETGDLRDDMPQNKMERMKKPAIFILMGIVFFGCMYLIFAPSGDKETVDIGLNDSVPEATEAGLQSDKRKAYEQEILESKELEKRKALQSLSDYWNVDTSHAPTAESAESVAGDNVSGPSPSGSQPSLNSYRNAQSALSSFYRDDNNDNQALRKEMEALKAQLAQQETRPANTLDNQLALMEKSYKLAAKYLPSGARPEIPADEIGGVAPAPAGRDKEHLVAFSPGRKNFVSALHRESTDSGVPAGRRFYTVGNPEQNVGPKNSIKACVDRTQTIEMEGDVRIRLLEPAKTSGKTIPQGAVLTANAKLEGGRLQLKVTSFEWEGNIIAVEIMVYDVDGQAGLYVPNSAEMEAVKEMAAKMGQTSGSSITMNQSAGQQIAGDLSKGLIQGISGYLSKKVTIRKVTLKAGHQLFLVSKK